MENNLLHEITDLLADRGYDELSPGCAIGVYHRGVPLAEVVRGVRELGRPEPITPTTNFRLASVTKQFTAACILQLVEAGRLRLDDSLSHLIPDFPSYGDDIALADLVGHTSGLKDYEDLLPPDLGHTLRDADVLEILRGQSEGDFAPGSRYSYSNSGYAILALIVERTSGLSFPDYLKKNIFEPSGMTSSLAWDSRYATVPERAMGHRRDEAGAWEVRDQSSTSSVLGDGGIYTSIREYAGWDRALASGTIISNSGFEQAVTSGRLDDGTATGYGFGWRLEQKRGRLVTHHTGGTTGFNTFARRIPSLDLCTIYLSNRNGEEPKELAPLIEDLALDFLGVPRS